MLRLCPRVPCARHTRHVSQDKSVAPSPALLGYCEAMSSPLHPALARLQADTRAALSPAQARMLTPAPVLRLNMAWCRATRARTVLDIGVFTGSSSLAAALATDSSATVLAAEKSGKYVETARRYWRLAGVEHKVEVRLGPALDTLDTLLAEGRGGTVDFTYIDADKANYGEYFKRSVELARRGGVIAVDNTLFRGEVLEPASNTAAAVHGFNLLASSWPGVEVTVLPLADGYTVAIKQ